MGSVTGNYKLAGDVAFTLFTSQTIDPTVTGAQAALLQD